jgi:hypothetical protein
MDPALAALQGLSLGGPPPPHHNQDQAAAQGNALLGMLQGAQQPLQQPQGGGLWGGPPLGPGPHPAAPPPGHPAGPPRAPPPGFAPPPPMQQQYNPLAGLPGFTPEPMRALQQPGPGPYQPGPPPLQFHPPPMGQQPLLPQQQLLLQQQQQLHQQQRQAPPGYGMYGPPPPMPPHGMALQQQRMQAVQQGQPQQHAYPSLQFAGPPAGPMGSLLPQHQAPPPSAPTGATPDSLQALLESLSRANGTAAPLATSPSPGLHSPRSPAGDARPSPMRVPAFHSHRGGHAHRGGASGGSKPSSGVVGDPREGRWVDVMDRSHDGRPPRCDMQKLNESLEDLAESLMPTSEEKGKWQGAFEAVQKVILARWPAGRVVLFGSAANGLSVRSSNDIDVSVQLDDVGDDVAAKGEVIEEAALLLEAARFSEMLSLPKARVPVVKCAWPSTGTKVDVTINNTLACINTKLLADYCAVDPRLAKLVAVVKHWAKKRAVNDPYRGTLSSYCYVLMCIYHLQSRQPPVLPVLQALPPTVRVTVREWTAEFFDDVAALKGFGDENKQSLAELVWQFFEYWAWKHDYMHGVVSVRCGRVVSKDDKDWTRRVGNERHLLCVEDPFELSHDLGRTVDKQTRDVMRKEFLRAATLMRDSEDPLDKVFEPYRPRGEKK